jgi:hypothetical protein
MKNVRTPWLVAFAAGTLATCAMAQPALDANLGTLTPGSLAAVSVGGVAGGTVRWYKFTLPTPVRYQDLRALDIWSFNASGTVQDTEIALFDSLGNRVGVDDDDGSGNSSALSFGTGGGGFPAGTNFPVANNGRDGDLLAAGDYYLGVASFEVTWGTTNWNVITPSLTALTGFEVTVFLRNITPVDPAGTVNLGTLAYNTTANSSAAIAANQVRWFKVNLPAANNGNATFVDMDTEGSVVTGGATRMVLYTPSGTLAASSILSTLQDTTDGSGSLSQLTFGLVNPSRPAVGSPAGLAYNGRDGDLRPGLYYIGIAATGTAPSTTSTVSGQNFGFVSTSTNTGTVNVNIAPGVIATSPTGTGSIIGCALDTPSVLQLRVNVTPGINPTSTIVGVSVNCSALGLGIITLNDNGFGDDGIAGNNIFGRGIVTTATPAGTYNLPFIVNDAQGRSSGGNIAVTVRATPTGAETIAGARVPAGSPGTPLTTISGNFEPARATIHQIQICDEAAFSASVVGSTTVDTQMFLFNADGTGVAMNDDVVGGTGAQSALSSNFVTANGTYYLAIVQYDRDPVSSICNDAAMWLDTPFRSERAPDGPGATGTLAGWISTPVTPSSGPYTITLTGACVPGTVVACDDIDFNNDGVFPDDQDSVDFFNVLAGADCPQCNDIDFNNNDVFPEDQDVIDFFNVLAGGECP